MSSSDHQHFLQAASTLSPIRCQPSLYYQHSLHAISKLLRIGSYDCDFLPFFISRTCLATSPGWTAFMVATAKNIKVASNTYRKTSLLWITPLEPWTYSTTRTIERMKMSRLMAYKLIMCLVHGRSVESLVGVFRMRQWKSAAARTNRPNIMIWRTKPTRMMSLPVLIWSASSPEVRIAAPAPWTTKAMMSLRTKIYSDVS